MLLKGYTLICLTILLTFSSIAGGGWSQNKSQGFFKLGQNMIRAGYFFSPDGSVVEIPTVSLYTTSLYGEYGFTDRLTGIAYVPFFVRSTLNEIRFKQTGQTVPGDAVTSFGDTDIGIKYGFFQDKPVVLAASLIFGLPFGSSEVSSERILQTGDGEFNQLVKLEASRSFYPAPFYASLAVGFNNRTKGFSDEFHYGAEVGYTPTEKWVAILRLYSVNSLYNGSASETQANGVFANNVEYLSFGPEVLCQFYPKWGASAMTGFAFSGKRILAAPNFGIGVFFKP